MFEPGTKEYDDLWEALWDAIVDVRDAYPRVYDDAPTDEVIDAVLDVLPGFAAKVIVRTKEDLESLPAGTILRDKNGGSILKGTGSCVGTGDGPPIELAIDEYLPATVLYNPARVTPYLEK